MTKEELARTMAKALAEVCLHAYFVDCWIQHCVDPECVAEDDLVDGHVFQSQPWYELSKILPVSEGALLATVTGGPHRDWDEDVAALAEYITATVMEVEKGD